MTLDAAVRAFLATKPDAGSPDVPVAQRRRAILAASDSMFDTFGEPAAPVGRVEDHLVARGADTIRVRVYRPDGDGPRPIHVFFHGGGFWLGSIDERVVDATCRERCLGAGCVVVSVDYRLAPEHRFPLPIDDCYEALVWTEAHADEIGGDASRITVGGVSAGANLAAAVAVAARERGGPALALQVLEVPPLDLTLATMRSSGVGDEFGITVAEMQMSVELYLPSTADAAHPLASPLLVDDLAGLPPAHVMTAEFDPLRRDGELYAQRLQEAGVPADHRSYRGAVHGSILLTRTWAPARTWRADVIAAIRRAGETPTATAPQPAHPERGNRHQPA